MTDYIKQKLIAMSGVMLALLLAALDQTAINTALPQISAELGDFELYSWVFTAYMLASTTCVPIVGKLSDIYGRRPLLLLGIVIFLLGSALCGLAPSMRVLIAFRALQGIGAGLIMANTFAIIGDIFTPAERGRWQGLIGAVFGLASIIGPLVGGFLTDNLSWRWVFYINLPVGILAFSVIMVTMPYIKPQGKSNVDYAGAGLLILGVVPLLLAFTWAGQEYAWFSLQIISMFIIAAVALTAFFQVERRAAQPIIPLDLFKNPIFSLSVFIVFLTGIGFFGSMMFIPLFVQGVGGSSATASGMVLMPMMLANVVSSTLSGQALSRWGHYKLWSIAGFAFLTLGLGLSAMMTEQTSSLVLIRNMVIMGMGIGISMPLFVLIVQNALPHKMLGVATSSIQFFRQIGGTIGVALMGSLMTFSLKSQMSEFEGASLAGVGNNLGQLQALLKNPEQFGLSPQTLLLFREAMAVSITRVFLVAALLMAAGIIAAFFLKEIPLSQSHEDEINHEHAESTVKV